MAWQVQSAKQKFSELVDRAVADGPQVVTRHGRPVVVVLDVREYRRLQGDEAGFKRFLREAPDFELLEIERSAQPSRAVEL